MTDHRGEIDVTEIDPRLLVQVAFSGSRPQGLGFLHHRPGGLDESTLNEIIERSQNERHPGEIHLDYLHGRSMKFHVRVDEKTGRRFINLDWYDHSREETKHLVRECGLTDVEVAIAKAEAEKDEIEREYEARKERAAQSLVRILTELGRPASSDEAPFANYYNLPDGDPVSEAWMYGVDAAYRKGWVTCSDGRPRKVSLTDAGRENAR